MKQNELRAPSAPWGVYGHAWAVDHLRQSIGHGRVRHAYLMVGAESVGKDTLARAFAAALLCTDADPDRRPCGVCPSCQRIASGNHPDVFYTVRGEDETTLSIDAIRAQIGRLALKPFEGRYRFGIFPDFDQVRPLAQDALLKTLEEPAPHAILILLARSIEPILPTITSRSQILHLRPASLEAVRTVLQEQCGADAETAALLAHLSGGRIGWAIRALNAPEALKQRSAGLDLLMQAMNGSRAQRFELAADLGKDRDKAALGTLLTLWQSFWRDLLLRCHDAPVDPANIDRQEALDQLAATLTPDEALRAMEATNRVIERLGTNINLRLALEVMLLDFPGLSR